MNIIQLYPPALLLDYLSLCHSQADCTLLNANDMLASLDVAATLPVYLKMSVG